MMDPLGNVLRQVAQLLVALVLVLRVTEAQLAITASADEPPPSTTTKSPASQSPSETPANEAPSKDAADRDAADKAGDSGEQQADKTSSKREDEDYELLRLFVDTMDQIERNYVKNVSRRELMEAAIRGMTSKLDQYSNYIPPDEVEGFKGSVESEFGGVGLQVGLESGRVIVLSPIPDTPAARAGVQAGDWITAVDGQSTRDFTLDETVKRMKGKPGTSVRMTITRARDGESQTLELKREVVKVDTVLGERRKADGTWDFWLDPERKIALIRLTSFSRRTAADLKKALKPLVADGLRGLVLDLRFNPGGLLTSAIEVSDLFVSSGKIVSTAGRNVQEQVFNARPEGTLDGFPMVVLVNRFSASASEIVSACLQDHERALIVGERTWGKGSVQNIIELEDGKSALKLTTAGYQRPNGKNINRFEGAKEEDDWGVRPNEGYLVKLDNDELGRLVEDRRRRDLPVPVKGDVKKSDEPETKKEEEKPEQEKPEQEKPEEKKPAEGAESGRPFVDRQLAKALEYLHEKLGAAPAPAVKP